VNATEALFAVVSVVILACTVALIALIHAAPVDNSSDKP